MVMVRTGPRAVRASRVRHADAAPVILNIGLIAVLLAIPVSVATRSTALTPGVSSWVIPLAIIALALGIPHGAVDHLTISRKLSIRQFAGLGLVYAGVAGLATAAIIAAPIPAFILVLVMSVWHFGTGDVEATHELQGTPQERGTVRVFHVLAAGSAPVLLPLTSPAAAKTLTMIQPELGQLITPTVLIVARTAVLTLVVIALLMLIDRQQTRAAVELASLAALGCFASPLLAFAVYFGFWHALRHTARLAQHSYGRLTFGTLGRTFRQGLPSLVGFVIVVGVVASRASSLASAEAWLWFGLAIVWGLTIPHMALVAAFDHRRDRI